MERSVRTETPGVHTMKSKGLSLMSICLGALALQAYESQRPSAAEACRVGDARFLNARSEAA